MDHGTKNSYYHCKKEKGVACRECKDASAAYSREWLKEHPEYRERKRELRRAWNKANPDKKREFNRQKNHQKRARLKNVRRTTFSTKDVIDLWGTDCHICGGPIDMRLKRSTYESQWTDALHLDHVIPIAKGGAHIISNVKPSHGRCNLEKLAKV